MYYFKKRETAEQLFRKIGSVPEGTKTIFLVVERVRDIKNLQSDLITLLPNYVVEARLNSIRIKGTKTNPAIKIFIVRNDPIKIKGLPKEATIYVN